MVLWYMGNDGSEPAEPAGGCAGGAEAGGADAIAKGSGAGGCDCDAYGLRAGSCEDVMVVDVAALGAAPTTEPRTELTTATRRGSVGASAPTGGGELKQL